MKFTIRRLMLVVVISALLLLAVIQVVRTGPPAKVLNAVQKQVPGIKVESVRPEIFNKKPAWEVTGTDKKGVRWMIDVRSSGEILMYEPW
jgi:hypothetical protein